MCAKTDEEAIGLFDKALAARRAILGDTHYLIAEVYCGLANAYTSQGMNMTVVVKKSFVQFISIVKRSLEEMPSLKCILFV